MKKVDDVLKDAREAYDKLDYSTSLENYIWLYDNLLKIDESYVGMRYRVVLREWKKLGYQYKPAFEAMIDKTYETYDHLQKEKSKELFWDYVHLCDILGESKQAVEEFSKYHDNNKSFAKEVFKFIRDILINQKEWKLCSCYMSDTQYEYERVLDVFDKCMDMNPINYEWAEDFKKGFIKDIENLCFILQEEQQEAKIENILEQAYKDMSARGHGKMKFLFE